MKTKSLACLAVLLLAATAEARVKLVALPDRDRVVISLANQNGTLVEEERVLTLQKGVIPISNPTAMKSAALLPLAAAEPERQLAFKEAKKQQVRHSILGPRDTLLFYTFAEKSAVLVLRIGNTAAALPVTGTVHLFAPGTTAEDLGKWVNNQHSDGLFPDVPQPTLSSKLPDGTCTVTARELTGREKKPNGEDTFGDWKVKIAVKAHREAGKFHLPAFGDEANVFVVRIETR